MKNPTLTNQIIDNITLRLLKLYRLFISMHRMALTALIVRKYRVKTL